MKRLAPYDEFELRCSRCELIWMVIEVRAPGVSSRFALGERYVCPDCREPVFPF